MPRLLALLVLIFIAACQPRDFGGVLPTIAATGYLQGHVTIGPLTPVERVDRPTPTVPPQVYTAREVIVYKLDGQTEIARTRLDANGNYRFTLAPGDYVVNMARLGIDRPKGVPVTVTIERGKTVTLDITIDTGIR